MTDLKHDSKATNWKTLCLYLLFIMQFSMIPFSLTIFSGLNSGANISYIIIYSLPWLLVPALFPSVTRLWIIMIAVIFGICATQKLTYFLIYQQDLSQSVFYTIFETDHVEAQAFAAQYFNLPMLLLFCVVVGMLLIWTKYLPSRLHLSQRAKVGLVTLILLSHIEPLVKYWNSDLPLTEQKGFGKLASRYMASTPWQTLISFYRYKEQQQVVQRYIDNITKAEKNIEITLGDSSQEQVYVLVIGESTNRERMQVYGYSRKTTPKLMALRDELFIFNNAVANRPFTIESLTQAMTFADQKHPSAAFENPNIIQLMHAAGFKTYWITNQQTVSKRNVLLTAFAMMSEEQIFLNNNRKQSSTHLDERVFSPYRKILAEKEAKKFIVVHLLGTHFGYHHRYSPEYEKFNLVDEYTRDLSSDDAATYNSYDNAILYNDFVVSTLIKDLRSKASNSMLLYFADHGEEVFDSTDFVGRNEGKPTPAMYTVPFLMWASPKWKDQRKALLSSNFLDRPHSLDQFIHSWCSLASLTFSLCIDSKSVVSESYSPYVRWIGDPNKPKRLRPYEEILGHDEKLVRYKMSKSSH